MSHPVRVTRTHLADGRELLYFDDEEPFLSGESTRTLEDPRDLPTAHTQSEMRRDPLTGEWNVYAAHRMNRTFMPPANENPLAPSKPGELPTEIPADDYNVVVFENRFPSLSLHMEEGAEALDSGLPELYPQEPARGRCEVVCFTPEVSHSFRDLSPHRVRTVIEVWAHRTAELSAIEGIRLVFPFENRGEEIGVTLQHPHGQIYSYPYVPTRAQSILTQSQAHRSQTGRDLFEDILQAEQEDGRRIIRRGEHFLVFVPAAAKWPVEAMIMPLRDVKDFADLTEEEKDELAVLYLDLLRRIDQFFEGVEKTPYISAWNQAVVGEGREFGRFHLQLFSLMRSPGRMKFLAGSESGQSAWISDTTPERIAQRFQEIGEQA
ncbi:galactose-1-phosphate uridylyltransferase [Corynebacterium uropygiale]|uniref:Galactose-1-phosphate uridylyltransferase n=1 Tax=Corynebacterium uropygiale TaxID=1775911 RepID=A0A9X1QRX9_9CORY|nr:galactose-1-phosphate uridylyltransferase [Corynebacterium uropygiale]MCF4006434.1 galactose-1-phosphate uridylyltransferase [Corynebacterium uropygiale]